SARRAAAPVQRSPEIDPAWAIWSDPARARPRYRHALPCPRRGAAEAGALPRDVRARLASSFGAARPHPALVGDYAHLGLAEPPDRNLQEDSPCADGRRREHPFLQFDALHRPFRAARLLAALGRSL